MITIVEAIYEKGFLRLTQSLPFAEGTRVEVTVTASEPDNHASSPADILDAIASLPIEGQEKEHSSLDHNRVLYGEIGTE